MLEIEVLVVSDVCYDLFVSMEFMCTSEAVLYRVS